MVNPERRKRVRVEFRADIILETGDLSIRAEGSSTDLSLGGIFVKTDERFSVDTPCRVQVVLSGTLEPVVLKMEGRVVRCHTTGVAVTFDAMDLDSYSHLKNIVRYNTDNPDTIE